jgi:hypothetical protein
VVNNVEYMLGDGRIHKVSITGRNDTAAIEDPSIRNPAFPHILRTKGIGALDFHKGYLWQLATIQIIIITIEIQFIN